MLIQDQLPGDQINDENLSFLRAIGVDCLSLNPVPFAATGRGESRLSAFAEMRDYLLAKRELAEKHGLRLYSAEFGSGGLRVTINALDEIVLARPQRDLRIEQWVDALRAMGAAGVPTAGYNFKPIGNFRTTSSVGRGGALYERFNYGEWERTVSPADFPDKQIDEDAMWENIQYFLERIVPVAEENDVRLALHPDDPPIPEPMGGAARIVSTLDQYRRIFDLVPSDASGMMFCQGCVTEMGVDVCRAIHDIGSMNKIIYVHFRNVRGTPRDFQEVFLDEGDVDMYETMQAYRDVGFKGPFMMDHTPKIPGDLEDRAGRAFATGYMRALLQAVYRSSSLTY